MVTQPKRTGYMGDHGFKSEVLDLTLATSLSVTGNQPPLAGTSEY